MSYLVPDIEAASIPGGELQSFGLTHSAYPMAPPVDLHVFENLIAADSAVAVSARHIEQVMDAVPQHMFILEPDATLSFVNRAAREYLGRIDAITPTERLGAIIHP
jgi:hypothetical protein